MAQIYTSMPHAVQPSLLLLDFGMCVIRDAGCPPDSTFVLTQPPVLSQIAFTAGWTAISSLIGYYKALYGPHMLLHLNLAYFLPSLPTLILQSVWDARLDGKYGIAKAATVRLCLGMWTLCRLYVPVKHVSVLLAPVYLVCRTGRVCINLCHISLL